MVFVRHGLDDVVLSLPPFQPLRFLLVFLPWNWLRHESRPRGERIRRALEDLGPVFIKFGQLLSVRPDLVPEDVTRELASLRDHVPPFQSDLARDLIERGFGEPVEKIFATFDEVPMASASIAQVHAATLHDGTEVVVKVVRPDIEKTIHRDIDLLYTLADMAEKYWRASRPLRPREVVAEYEKTILDELDMQREAASASQLARMFEDSDLLQIPQVYWDYTREKVLVMERVSGIAVDDTAALTAAGIDLQRLAERGVEIFFTQVFKHNFFHADMHPGNIFVARDAVERPRYVAVDFGIMGALGEADQKYLAENFLAFFNRDYARVAELHLQSGWVPATTRVDEFEAAIRTVCEPIFQRPLREISFGQLLVRLFQTARRFDVQVQPQLVLLQKTLLHVEGLGRQLYPDLDLWKTAKPFLEQWLKERYGIKPLVDELKRQAPRWSETMPALPNLIHDVLRNMRDGKFVEPVQRARQAELRAGRRREHLIARAVTGGALTLSAVVLLGQGFDKGPLLFGYSVFIWAFAVTGLVVLARVLLSDE
ncbi:MAG: ubiquinone biosynthesis regulatory protein kinase UbiB [Gammaproteobacteria bacterium]|nr:ubiquinone biosynthesis regulatory protein kinase UbiB [Gammaproteobacteria bacterium]